MEQRRVYARGHWYHETQSRRRTADKPSLTPLAAPVTDRFLLDLALPAAVAGDAASWLTLARTLAAHLLPDAVSVTSLHTFSLYERISTALTVAQVFSIQRLCSHYAARLAPLPGPDSSRESNYRLAQITQFARQLAGSPSIITGRARQQLRDVGLTAPDMMIIAQIVGFISWQAQTMAAGQALLAMPVRWIPGMPEQDEAGAAPFSETLSRWQPDPDIITGHHFSPRQSGPIDALLHPFVPLLGWDNALAEALSALLPLFPQCRLARMAALLSARINGSVSCFNVQAARSGQDIALVTALRQSQSESAVQQWVTDHPRDRAFLQASRQLIRAPARFSTALFTPLLAPDFCASQAFTLLAWCGLCGWLNRLKISLGEAGTDT